MKITREEESKIKGTPEVSAPAPTETPEQPAAAAKPATRWAAIPLWGRVLLILGIALLLLVFVGYAALQGMLGRIRRASATEAVSQQEETFESDENADDTLSPEDVIWNGADTSVMQDKDIVNLLLIGQDRREGQDRQRSDSMIMVTLNKKTKQISMTSFMRDLYVQIPGYSDNRINATYAFGGMDLVRGDGDHVRAERFGAEWDLQKALHGVGMEQDTPLLYHFSDLLNRKNGTGLIVGEHDGDNGRIFAHSVRQFVQIQAPFGIHAQIRQLIPLLLQMLPEGDKRRMFNTGRDDMLFFRLSLQSGHHGSGIAFRAARGEHDLFRLRTKHRRNLFPCILNALAHLPAERVHARGITIFFRKKRNHAFKNFRRYAGRGVVI